MHNRLLREFLVAQTSPESQELAKAVCKVGCLRDCLQNLQTKASKDEMVSRTNCCMTFNSVFNEINLWYETNTGYTYI